MTVTGDVMGKTVQFGCFELDLADSTLRKSGRRVHLQSQPLKVLSALIEASGNVVTRDQLKALVWPSDTFVDFDKSLNTAIMKIRHTLGDSAQSPRYLETVPRLGYRFLPPVTIVSPPVIQLTKRRAWRRDLLFASCGVVSVTLAALYLGSTFRNQSRKPYLPSAPLTTFAGSEIVPSFSPDGEKVAFAWDGERQQNFDIYTKEIASGRLHRLTDDPRDDVSPAWSPDGRSIAYIRVLSGTEAKIFITPAQDVASTRCVATLPAPSPYYVRFKLLAWSPDSKNLVYTESEEVGGTQSLYLLDVGTGARRRLTSPPPNFDDLSPTFSRDGTRLAFVRYCGRTSGDLYVVPVSRTMQQAVPLRKTSFERLVGTPAWSPTGRTLVFARYDMPGIPSLWRVPWPSDASPEPLPITSDTSLSLDLSPDGTKLVYSRESFNTNIWAAKLDHALKAWSIEQWASSSLVDYNPQFSPDGRQVVFSSLRSGRCEIWIAESNGSHARQMTHNNGTVSGFPRWSPDGHSIVFHLRSKSSASLYRLIPESGQLGPVPMLSQNDYNPSYSQDGKWIYFSSRRTGSPEVWKVAPSGGVPIQLTRRGGLVPLESPDGHSLYYVKAGSFDLWRQPSGGGEESRVFPGVIAAKGTSYAVTDSGVYLIRSDTNDGAPALGFFDLKMQRFHAIARLLKPLELGLGVSPDQRTILFAQQDQLGSDLMLVSNFAAQ